MSYKSDNDVEKLNCLWFHRFDHVSVIFWFEVSNAYYENWRHKQYISIKKKKKSLYSICIKRNPELKFYRIKGHFIFPLFLWKICQFWRDAKSNNRIIIFIKVLQLFFP